MDAPRPPPPQHLGRPDLTAPDVYNGSLGSQVDAASTSTISGDDIYFGFGILTGVRLRDIAQIRQEFDREMGNPPIAQEEIPQRHLHIANPSLHLSALSNVTSSPMAAAPTPTTLHRSTSLSSSISSSSLGMSSQPPTHVRPPAPPVSSTLGVSQIYGRVPTGLSRDDLAVAPLRPLHIPGSRSSGMAGAHCLPLPALSTVSTPSNCSTPGGNSTPGGSTPGGTKSDRSRINFLLQ